jgi:pyruvate dehydrogenase E1 component beta subunit
MRTIEFREALREAMSEEMRRDQTIFLMGEEVAEYNGAYKVSKGMLAEFGEKRVIDTPIAELGFAGIGVGAACNGLRPIIEFMTFNFSLVAIDQIINSAAKIYSMSGGQYNCPIVFRGPTASAGMLSSQHSQAFENWFANCPGLKVIVPSNPYDAKGLLKSAIRDNDPVIFMESEQMYGDKGEVPEEEYIVPIGVADIKKQGTDVTIVSFGKILKVAMNAAKELEAEGIYTMMKQRGIKDEYFDRFNYENYGGTPILGVKGNVIIGHGISNNIAVKNMILLANEVAMSGLATKVNEAFN